MSQTNQKVISTRIKNKVANLYDDVVNKTGGWQDSQGILLNGEIAIVRVPTVEFNPITGEDKPSWDLLIKVGDGVHVFAELPWLSAKAADVYDWAKKPEADFITWLNTAAKFATDEELAVVAGDLAILSGKVDVDTVSAAIAEAVKALTDLIQVDQSKEDLSIVKAVTQKDGQVTVTYGKITKAELPTLLASDIVVVEESGTEGQENYVAKETLDTRLATLGGNISKLDNNKLDDITVTVTPENAAGIVKTVTHTAKGTVTVTHGTVDTAEITNSAIITDKIADSAVTNAKVAQGIDASKILVAAASGDTTTTYLDTTVEDLYGKIGTINTAIAGGVHFRGTVNAQPTTTTTAVNGSTVAAGDVVIYDGKEYICVSVSTDENNATVVTWEELGDVTRVGAIETKINGLTTDTRTTDKHEFVTHITLEADGTFKANTARPTAANVEYDNTQSVADKIEAVEGNISSNYYDKTATDGQISSAINKLAFTDSTTATGDYVTGLTLSDGVVTVSKGNLPVAVAAETPTAGIIKLYNSLVDQTDGTTTSAAIKTAVDGVSGRVSTVEGNYVKFVPNTDATKPGALVVGSNGTEEIIFDCGGLPPAPSTPVLPEEETTTE